MTLSENDYIMVGIGHLYGAPVMSRFLIYRLYESNQTILIYHQQETRVSASIHGKVTEMVATCGWPTTVYVHSCSASAFANLNDLLELPATEMPVPRSVATIERFNNLTIRLESFDLAYTEKMLAAYENKPIRTLRIGKSDYDVTGPINVAYWPEKVQYEMLKLRCMKVSISTWNDKMSCNIESIANWSLTALDMEEGRQPTLEVTLKRRTQ
jgi:hypothetical protein